MKFKNYFFKFPKVEIPFSKFYKKYIFLILKISKMAMYVSLSPDQVSQIHTLSNQGGGEIRFKIPASTLGGSAFGYGGRGGAYVGAGMKKKGEKIEKELEEEAEAVEEAKEEVEEAKKKGKSPAKAKAKQKEHEEKLEEIQEEILEEEKPGKKKDGYIYKILYIMPDSSRPFIEKCVRGFFPAKLRVSDQHVNGLTTVRLPLTKRQVHQVEDSEEVSVIIKFSKSQVLELLRGLNKADRGIFPEIDQVKKLIMEKIGPSKKKKKKEEDEEDEED